jgi:hypothetical protein
VRSRTFSATIPDAPAGIPANPFFIVRPGGASFFEDWNTIDLGHAGESVAFWLETLVEQIAPDTFLAFGGQAAASVSTSDTRTITLPFAGSIDYCVTTSQHGRYSDCHQGQVATNTRCESNSHQLILTRR